MTMIDVIMNGIAHNTSKINSVSSYVNKIDKRTTIQIGLVIFCLFAASKTINGHGRRLHEIEKELKSLKSKGE